MGHAHFLPAWRLTRGLAQITIGAEPFVDLSPARVAQGLVLSGGQTDETLTMRVCSQARVNTYSPPPPLAFVQLILSLSGFEELLQIFA